MKINPIFTLIALFLTGIFSYSLYVFSENDFKTIYVSLGSICIGIYLCSLIGVNFGDTRKNINIKTLTSFFLLLQIIILVYFSFQNKFLPSFIISTGLLMIIYLASSFFISKQNN
jgi:hypothetical protein